MFVGMYIRSGGVLGSTDVKQGGRLTLLNGEIMR